MKGISMESKLNLIHLHTYFSLGDALISPEVLVKRLQELGLDRVSITDHGNLYHIFKFAPVLNKAGIKYFPGCEFYFCDNAKVKDKEHRKKYHLIAVAKTEQGVKNLYKLSSLSFTEGFYYAPRIDFEMIKQYNDGLIFSSACLKGKIDDLLLQDKYEEAKEEALRFKNLLGNRFYIEIMPHNIDLQVKANELLVKLANELDIPLIATCDSHFAYQDEAEKRRFLMLMNKSGWAEDDEEVGKLDSIYMMSADDMKRTFKIYHPNISEEVINKAIENTGKFLEGEQPVISTEEIKLPVIKNGFDTEEDYFLDLISKGLDFRKCGDNPKYIERLKYEYGVIKEAGFINYFLVMHELFEWCRSKNIYSAPCRGSGGGSLVAYLLHITNVDPIKYGLMFERFYNAGRKGPEGAPDIDSDFEDERRGEVVEHLKERYGASNVSQICNISQIKIKSGIKDVARVLGISVDIANKITSTVEWDNYETIEEAEKIDIKAKEIIHDYPELFKYVKYFQGFPRHLGKHAAGIVIADENIGNICPMKIEKEDDILISQFDKNDIKHTGLIKFDILGLSTMTFLKKMVEDVKLTTGKEINLLDIPTDDKKVYDYIFKTADTENIFQLESNGMREYLKKLQPDTFLELVVLNSLYRPAGIISGSVDKYIHNKFDKNNIEKSGIKEFDDILEETNYVVCFDEQKMKLAIRFGDFTLQEANKFRKEPIKWSEGQKEYFREKFVTNAVKKGLPLELAQKTFEGCCGYSFCQAHSTGYSLIGYWTAWFKYYYPQSFLKASFYMSSIAANVSKYSIKTALKFAERLGYTIRKSDINKSKSNFNFDDNNLIIYWGFNYIKGIGEEASKVIETNQPYIDFNDFLNKVKGKKITKRQIVPLIMLGAFDNLPNGIEQIKTWWIKNKYNG